MTDTIQNNKLVKNDGNSLKLIISQGLNKGNHKIKLKK